ncbi:RNA polymerase sigma factor [Terrimonas alba]|uniref:RNA polymerase sigma factor n=1 Tax=Terrimonas alba TaxID=3349636 RepID=UPI0035F2758A
MREKENARGLFLRLTGVENESALWELHALFFHPLYRLIYSITHHKEVAEELTNDVFVQIWQSRKKIGNVENPEVYLFVCARNIAFTYLKSIKAPVTSIEDIQQFDLHIERTPEDMLVSSEMVARINAAIRQLPPKCKLTFLLVKENNLKYREVAEILGLSVKTVEAQMSIALKKLSQSIPFLLPAFSR